MILTSRLITIGRLIHEIFRATITGSGDARESPAVNCSKTRADSIIEIRERERGKRGERIVLVQRKPKYITVVSENRGSIVFTSGINRKGKKKKKKRKPLIGLLSELLLFNQISPADN